MRRFLGVKSLVAGMVLLVVALVAGVTWAANSSAPSSSNLAQNDQKAAKPIIVVINSCVQEGRPELVISGAGFRPNESVWIEVLQAPPRSNIPVGGVQANATGSFAVTRKPLTAIMAGGEGQPAAYTVTSISSTGNEAVYPLLVTKGKCPA